MKLTGFSIFQGPENNGIRRRIVHQYLSAFDFVGKQIALLDTY